MRLHRGVPMLAAVVTLTGLGTPAAYAFKSETASAGAQPTAALVQHHPSGSTDWVLIGVVGAGAITLAGAGVSASRGFARRTVPPHDPRPAGGS